MAYRFSSPEIAKQVSDSSLQSGHTAPPKVTSTLWSLVAIGVIAFVAGLVGGYQQRAWQIYFVNFLFWSGIAQGGVVMSAVYRITNAGWGDQFRRIGEAMVSFLPVSFVLYLVLVFGGQSLFPWIHDPPKGKEVWLSAPFLFGRDGAIFLFLMWLSYKYVSHSARSGNGQHASEKSLIKLTPLLLLSFALLYSLIGFDLVMALDPEWYSTLFGWLYFLHAFYAALVMITILAVLSSKWFHQEGGYTTNQWHDMGRFVFGFCLLSGGFFWSQFLVIWYGNLPEETSYLIKRFYSQPWEPLMWAYVIFAYLFPLAVFLSKKIKQVPNALLSIAFVIFIALFLERFIAVVPFVWHEPTIPFGLIELCVTVGFAGAFTLSWLRFVKTVSVVLPKT